MAPTGPRLKQGAHTGQPDTSLRNLVESSSPMCANGTSHGSAPSATPASDGLSSAWRATSWQLACGSIAVWAVGAGVPKLGRASWPRQPWRSHDKRSARHMFMVCLDYESRRRGSMDNLGLSCGAPPPPRVQLRCNSSALSSCLWATHCLADVIISP